MQRGDDLTPTGAGESGPGGFSAPLEAPRVGVFGGLPGGKEAQLDAVTDLRDAGPVVADLLRSHSFLTGRDESITVAELFDRDALEWDFVRQGYLEDALTVATSLVLTESIPGDRFGELAVRIGFGLDQQNQLLRDRLFGRARKLPDFSIDDFELPRKLIGFDELLRRTCVVGVLQALSAFGRAAAGVPREWTAGAIERLIPARGCDGDWIEILGHDFGASQPPDVILQFTAYKGGPLVATVDPRDWSDTRIRVRAPVGVGSGPVGFVRSGSTGATETVASAAEQLAGEAEACFGLPAMGFAQRLRTLGPSLDAPHVSSTSANRFAGGPPRIMHFTGNGATRALLRPRGPLVLSWFTDNADSVEIKTSGPPDLPVVPSGLPVDGEQRFASVNATGPWTGSYTLTATNPCGSVQQKVDVEMRERRALVLAGGGSKGAFEVGAVRCLADVFGFRPDILCGASVGALNAAKLAEGPGALAGLESMWLGMQSSADLYLPTGQVARLVNDLHQLGITYIAGIDLADLLGVRLANYSWLSPQAQIGVGVVKHMLGAVEGAGSAFMLTDIIFGAARAGLLIGKVKQDIEKVIASPSLFVFDPVRQKIDGNIDQSKIAKSGLELRIATVNLDDGRTRYVDQRGRFVDNDYPVDLRDALQASASIPIAFPPVTLPGGHYVDGGVRDNAPIAAADIAGASSAIAVLPSPDHMDVHDYAGAAFPHVAARSFEAIFDETWQNDLAPFRGYRMPVTVIAPQIETHSILRVDPGLVQIDMDYGYMRAFDEMQPTRAKRERLGRLALEIAQLRIEVWGPTEHESEGRIRDETRGTWSYTKPVPNSLALDLARTKKHQVRARCEERVNLAKTLLATPPGIERAWQQWERHKWTPLIVSPWEASTAHVGPFVPKLAPPPALGPLPVTEQHIAYRDPKGFVEELWWTLQTGWQIGDAGAGKAAGDPAAYVLGETLHIVYRGDDDRIHELWWSPVGGWRVGTLEATAATTTSAAGDPHGYVLGSTQHVVYRGTDDLVHELWWSPAGGWQVGSLGVTKLAATASGDPFGYVLDGDQHVVYRGTDDLIHQLSWSPSGGWHVGTLGATAGVTAATGDPVAYILDGNQHVVYRGTDKLVHELWWSPSGGWQIGTLSAATGATAAAGDPYGYAAGGDQHVVYRGTDDLIHDLWWSAQTGWQVGTLAATPGAKTADGDPVGYTLQGARHVVYVGTDDVLHELWAPPGGAWQIGTLHATKGASPAAGRPAAVVA